jgi:hypothetical protein
MLAKLPWSPPRRVRSNAAFACEALPPRDGLPSNAKTNGATSLTHDGLAEPSAATVIH